MAQSSEIKLLKRFDQDVEITGNLTLGGNAIGINTDNFYLDGITKSGNTLTFSVNGATNQSYTFGSAAFANTTAFAAASHSHSYLPLSGGTVTGTVTINGSNGLSRLRIEGTTPTIDLDDSDGDSFYIHVNSNNFYVLNDRDGGGNYGDWEAPYALQLEADTNVGYVFGNVIIHSGNIGSQSVNYATSAGDAGTIDGIDSSRIIYGNNASGTNEGNYSDWDALSKTGFYSHSGAAGRWSSAANWSSVLHFRLYDDNNNYASQLGFNTYDNRIYARTRNAGTWTAWDEIITTGNKDSYTYPPASHDHDGVYVKEGGTSFSGEYPVVVRTSADVIYSDANIKFRGSDSRLTVDGSIETPRVKVTGSHNGNFGYASFSWAGSSGYPTLFSDHADRWVMICNPHVPYLENGINGYSGSTAGAVLTYAGNASTSTYWQAGIDSNVGADMFSISRANSGWEWYVDNSGNTYSQESSRATVFYDRNDTTYYFDPNSTDRSGRLRSCLTFNDYGAGVTGTYTSTRLQTIFNMGESYKIALDGSSASGAYGLYWSHQNAGGLGGANNLASHGILIIENGSWKGAWGGGSLRTPADVRAPIFYDYNNTGYYTDPASHSNVNTLDAEGYRVSTSSFQSSYSRDFYVAGDADKFYKVKISGTADFDRVRIYRRYNWTIGGSSVHWNSGSSSHFGALNFEVSTLRNNWGGHRSMMSGFAQHNYTTVMGRAHIGQSSENGYIIVYLRGGAGGSGAQYRLQGEQSHLPAPDIDYNSYITSADAEFNDNFLNREINIHSTDPYTHIADESHRSPIYYDSNDTGYYIDAASTSNLNTVTAIDYQSTSRQTAPRWDTAFYVLQAQHWYGDNSSQDMYLGESGNRIIVRSRLDSPIFYDYNDTSKYLTRYTGNYGAWRMGGNQGGYSGLEVDGGMNLMIHTGGTGAPCGFWSGNWSILTYVNGSQYLYYNGSEKFRTSSSGVTITGTLYATGDVIAYYSDARLKKDVVEIENAVDKVKKLRGVTYTWNDKDVNIVKGRAGNRDIGLIAQEVEAVEPLLITEYQTQLNDPGNDPEEAENFEPIMSESYKTIKYQKVVALLVEAIKEQQNQIDELKSLINKS